VEWHFTDNPTYQPQYPQAATISFQVVGNFFVRVGRWLIAITVLLAMSFVVLGYRRDKPSLIVRSPRPVSHIFEGFAYAGQDLRSFPETHVSPWLPRRLVVLPLPSSFGQGHEYFFHHQVPADDGMRVAQEVLAPRLRADGFTLTETVNGIFFRGFATWDLVGGGGITTWAIQFKRASCIGTIEYNKDEGIRRNPWPIIRDAWDPADYILRVEGACNL